MKVIACENISFARILSFAPTNNPSAAGSIWFFENQSKWPQQGQGASSDGNDDGSTQTDCPQTGHSFDLPSGVQDAGDMFTSHESKIRSVGDDDHIFSPGRQYFYQIGGSDSCILSRIALAASRLF